MTCHEVPGRRGDSAPALTIALAGQPNVGKSTVFNLLTASTSTWATGQGKRSSSARDLEHDGETLRIVDLPARTRSRAASPEETIARDYIVRQRPDAVIVVINAASLERNLYLVAELLALPPPLVIG